jgi:hypothetical protein
MNRAAHHLLPAPLLALLQGKPPGPCDLQAVWQVAVFQGVEASIAGTLLRQADQDLPESVRAGAEQARHFCFARNLQLLALLDGIKQAFEAEDIPWIAMKGPVFTEQYTGDLSMRLSGDLDLLVAPADALRADAALKRAGIHPERPLERKLRTGWGRVRQFEHEYYSRSPRYLVELHWHLTGRCYEVVDVETALARAQTARTQAGSFPVLSPEDTLVYYALHAFARRWHRLYHVQILDWILRKPLDWNQVQDTIRNARKTRPVFLGLLLAHELFRSPLPDGMLERIHSDQTLSSLSATVYRNFQRDRTRPLPSFIFKWRGLESWSDRLRLTGRALASVHG